MFGKERFSRTFLKEVLEAISTLHDRIISHSGGTKGTRDEGGLYHSTYKILLYQEDHSEDPASVGAFVYEELARRHHFNDGNKRTAHAFAKLVLFLMDHHFKIEYKDAVPFIIEVAKHESKVSFKEIKAWVKHHLISIPEEYENNVEKYLKYVIEDTKYEN